MDIKVIDLEYKERDFEYVKSKYGVAFRRAEVAPGQKVYRLIELWEKSGTASLVTQVLNDKGDPIADVDVAFYWPGAPEPPDPPTEVYPHDWHRNFVHGCTGGTGDVGPGMGPGAYHGKGEGGPHAAWVRDPNIPSDICEKLGMLAGTFHHHLDQKFKLMVEPKSGEETQPGGELKIKLPPVHEPWDSNMLFIAWPVALAVDADVHATSPASDDHDTTALDKWEHDGKEYAIAGVCANFNGKATEPRAYSIWAYKLPNPSDQITPVVTHQFQPLGQMATFEKITYVVDYTDEGPGAPPSGDLAKLYDHIADHHDAIAALYRKIAALYE